MKVYFVEIFLISSRKYFWLNSWNQSEFRQESLLKLLISNKLYGIYVGNVLELTKYREKIIEKITKIWNYKMIIILTSHIINLCKEVNLYPIK
jgi:hypothetical protein